MAAEFKKIIEHPDFQNIVDKLMLGDTPKEVSNYLQFKYQDPGDSHLRLSIALLDRFLKSYLNTSEFLDKVVRDEKNGVLDKAISKSLLNNATWRERIAALADEKIDVGKKLSEQLAILEQRQEQIFDKIQENPGNTKLDYVMVKYFELQSSLIEKIDKIVNKSPDIRVEHTHSVQVIEAHSQMLQDVIRKVISRLDPEMASLFMDMMNEEMMKLKPIDVSGYSVEKSTKELESVDAKLSAIDAKFAEIDSGE